MSHTFSAVKLCTGKKSREEIYYCKTVLLKKRHTIVKTLLIYTQTTNNKNFIIQMFFSGDKVKHFIR